MPLHATAVFLMNRLPYRSIGGETPYYGMFGKQAKLSFLRIMGSRVFVHKEGHLSKLEDKAWEGVLFGFDSDSPTYRICDRYSGKKNSLRYVTFI